MADPFDAEIRKIEPTTDVLKLDLRVGDEMDLFLGCIGVFVIGFVMIWVLGIPVESIWHSKLGADLGGAVCAIGVSGWLLHYVRWHVIKRRAGRLRRGETVANPLSRTFWSSSSDSDFVWLFAIAAAVGLVTYVS